VKGAVPVAAIVLAVGLGVMAGIGGYTFLYAEGFSYFKTDPRACTNCHIMQPQFDAWQKGSHHAVAVCIDCHLPHSFFAKYLAKTENGWRHGKMFTTQEFEEPITVKARGLEILQENCVRCHGELVSAEAPCLHCHAGVGHGAKAGLGGPLSKVEHGRGK
jgi:cytochrome c nitrite reductase small subunit